MFNTKNGAEVFSAKDLERISYVTEVSVETPGWENAIGCERRILVDAKGSACVDSLASTSFLRALEQRGALSR